MSTEIRLSAYLEKKVRCTKTYTPRSGAKQDLFIGLEYDVELTNISHPNHIPLVGFSGVFPVYCFETTEFRNSKECFEHVKLRCPRALDCKELEVC